jgi:hypothetical protein
MDHRLPSRDPLRQAGGSDEGCEGSVVGEVGEDRADADVTELGTARAAAGLKTMWHPTARPWDHPLIVHRASR